MASRPTLPSKQLARLKGHTGPIHALTYSSGFGHYLLSGSADRTINLYNPAKAISAQSDTNKTNTKGSETSGLIQSYSGAHGYDVLTIAVAPDNARFVSGGGDKGVFLWDVSTARTLRRWSGHGGRVECVAFGGAEGGGEGDVVVSGSYDATVRLWDVRAQGSSKPMMVLQQAKDCVNSVVVAGHEVIAGGVDGRVRSYDVRMGMVHTDVIGAPVTSVMTSLEADTMLVSTLDSTLRLMDRANGKLLKSYTDSDLVNKTYRIRSTLSAYDTMAVSGSEDGWIYAWDALSGELVNKVRHAEEQPLMARSSRRVVSSLAYKRKANEWASAGGDGTIVVWGT